MCIRDRYMRVRCGKICKTSAGQGDSWRKILCGDFRTVSVSLQTRFPFANERKETADKKSKMKYFGTTHLPGSSSTKLSDFHPAWSTADFFLRVLLFVLRQAPERNIKGSSSRESLHSNINIEECGLSRFRKCFQFHVYWIWLWQNLEPFPPQKTLENWPIYAPHLFEREIKNGSSSMGKRF